MADRRSVFSDSRITARADAFVFAADEVWRLQRGSDADCVFFQHAINKGQRITDKGTRQGIYVMAPSGLLLARNNSHKPEAVAALMEKALVAYEALDETARRFPEALDLSGVHRWEDSRPEDGLVLERIGRELTLESPAGEPSARWNRDHAWFSAEEVQSAFSTAGGPNGAAAGAEIDLDAIAARLARLHLVDNVRGQTIPYAAKEVRTARLRGRVSNLDGDELALDLSGDTLAVADGPWLLGDSPWRPNREVPHAIECSLAGTARYDLKAQRFTAFELFAIGRRSGYTVNNGRRRNPVAGRIGFHLSIATPKPSAGLPPTFVVEYDADWIAHPEVGEWVDSPAECGLEHP